MYVYVLSKQSSILRFSAYPGNINVICFNATK